MIIIGVVILFVVPLFIHKPHEGEELFVGADAKAEGLIGTIAPDYKTWFSPIFVPPSGEIETMLFCLQAAIGAGFIGYYIGYKKGLHTKEQGK